MYTTSKTSPSKKISYKVTGKAKEERKKNKIHDIPTKNNMNLRKEPKPTVRLVMRLF